MTEGHHLIGRDPQNDLRLEDSTVSRRHAAITVTNQGVWIEDLGSTGGTRVNHDVVTMRRLHVGDHIQLGTVSLRLDAYASTAATAIDPAAVDRSSGSQDIGSEHDGHVHDAVGNKHISHVQQINREREPLLRKIAATRTKARWLIWLGVLVSVVSVGWALVIVDGSFSVLIDAMSSRRSIPSFVWAAGLSTVGTVLLIVGVLLHITATARRRRIYREFPVTRREP